jgi:sugar/nucleoside kinase (ribokinase family)
MSLVVYGDLMVDVVARVDAALARGSDAPARIAVGGGGSGANVAAWAAWLGVPVALVCRVGDDERGRAAVAALRAGGVQVHAEVDAGGSATGTCLVLVEPDGERTMLPDPGANDAPAVVPDGLLGAGGHLHVIGYSLLRPGSRPGALEAIRRAREAGMTVSVDPSSWALLAPGAALGDAGLLLPNEREAAVLAGDDDPERAARALAAAAGRGAAPAGRGDGPVEVVVKLGAAGALWTDGDAVVRAAAVAVEVVDTTGAGDAFAAGLLGARLAGADPQAALEAACRTAARVVAQVGARPLA